MITNATHTTILANIKKCNQLTTEQYCQAYDILHDGFKANSSSLLKEAEMKSVFYNNSQPACSFERWVLLLAYLKSINFDII